MRASDGDDQNTAIQALASEWRGSGVAPGDTLLVHSSIKRTLQRYQETGAALTPGDILQSLLLAVGDAGTLLLPLFNFDFTKGIAFDPATTPSHMGALTEAGRQHPRAVRTGHPIYSFAVIGHHGPRFGALDNASGYGEDSPFALLRELGGKIAVLDLSDQKSMTFYHHVEEMHRVPYRYHKQFEGPYLTRAGNWETRAYSIYVRNLEEGVLTHVDPAGELMWQAGLYHGDRPGEGSGMRVVDANRMFDFVSEIIKENRAEDTLFRYEGKGAGV